MGSFSASFQNKRGRKRLPGCFVTKEREPKSLGFTSSCLGPSLPRQPGEPRKTGGRQQGPQGEDGLHQGAAAGVGGRVCSPQLPDSAPEIRDRREPGSLREAGGSSGDAAPLLGIPPLLGSLTPSLPITPSLNLHVFSLCPGQWTSTVAGTWESPGKILITLMGLV